VAKTAIGNDRWTKSNAYPDSHTERYTLSNADTQCHTNSVTYAECNSNPSSNSYTHAHTITNSNSLRNGNSYPKIYPDSSASTRPTSPTDTTTLREKFTSHRRQNCRYHDSSA
jgi:hypothetical protein